MPPITEGDEEMKPQIRLQLGSSSDDIIAFDAGKELVSRDTDHLRDNKVSARGIKCCGKSADLHVFASLRNISETNPLATVKIYLSNNRNIDDHQIVRIINIKKKLNKHKKITILVFFPLIISIHLLLQDLRRREKECGNPLFLLQSNEIHLSSDEYDASESEMILTLMPENKQFWKVSLDKLTHVSFN